MFHTHARPLVLPVPGGDDEHEGDVDEPGEDAADRAPLDRHRHHAVHGEQDEHVVPHHDVAVQREAGLLGAEAVEDAS